ncbi:MAG: hypothetical protein K0U84_12060, partial [Actinomycetia bacterium]|nr:hypothetical protein [Actinomycetes bacterium]
SVLELLYAAWRRMSTPQSTQASMEQSALLTTPANSTNGSIFDIFNVSISAGGHQLVQMGTAHAESSGFGSLAIAFLPNSSATADGLFSGAVALDDNTASAIVNGDGLTATAGPGDNNTDIQPPPAP